MGCDCWFGRRSNGGGTRDQGSIVSSILQGVKLMSRRNQPLKNDAYVIPKSRYDSVDCYIHNDPSNRPEYNDNKMPLDLEIKKKLMDDGIDELLANHFAHLFIRDPIVIFQESLVQDDETSSDHFEVSSLSLRFCGRS